MSAANEPVAGTAAAPATDTSAGTTAARLQETVARSADTADLHASVPTLLMEVQAALGALAATVSVATDRGRRPFRPDPEWAGRLGELAYDLYLLADQTSTDLDDAVLVTARQIEVRGKQALAAEDTSWPFETR